MPDALVRDEIWESTRFLDLHTDTQRLAFIRLLHLADDFGNLEAGPRRLFRIFTRALHVKSEQEAAGILAALFEVGLIIFYPVADPNADGGVREFIHIPRFRSHRSYKARRVPASPYCNAEEKLGSTHRKEVRVRKQGLAADLTATSPEPVPPPPPDRDIHSLSTELSTGDVHATDEVDKAFLQTQELMRNLAVTSQACHGDVPLGVDVDVGEEEIHTPKAQKSKRHEPFRLPDWLAPHKDVWDAWVEARTRAKHPPTDWAKWLAVSKLEQMQAEGHNVRRLMADAAFHNWQDFYPPKERR